jgi:hypothetical protein
MMAIVDNFISMLTAPGFDGAHGEIVYINLWIIITVHVLTVAIMLILLDYKTMFFYIAVTLISFLVYGCIEIVVFGNLYINLLFYLRIYLAFLAFPLISTYLFYKKIKKNIKS